MEIKFELENSDIECVFTPDFRVQKNTSDQTQVSWRLSSSRDAWDMGILCREFPEEKPVHPPVPGGSDV